MRLRVTETAPSALRVLQVWTLLLCMAPRNACVLGDELLSDESTSLFVHSTED